LLGDILNTNCRYLSRELAAMGIEMYYQITVGDNEERLLKTLDESLNRSDIVICTGGLGDVFFINENQNNFMRLGFSRLEK